MFENLKTGQKETRKYSQLYSIIPCKPHEQLIESGLATKNTNNLLDVNMKTLQHNKYKNIFGIGDVNNLPTTKTFYGGFHQVHVVRNNIQRNIKGQSLNAEYSGYTKASIVLSQNEITYAVHYYDQKPHFQNLLAKNGGIIASMRYYFWAKNQKKRFAGWYMKKSWGPPTFKLKRTFAKPAGEQSESKSIFNIFGKSADKAAENVKNVVNTDAKVASGNVAADAKAYVQENIKDAKNAAQETEKKGVFEGVKETVVGIAQEQKGKLGQSSGQSARNASEDVGQNVTPDRDLAPKEKGKQSKLSH